MRIIERVILLESLHVERFLSCDFSGGWTDACIVLTDDTVATGEISYKYG